MSKSKSESHTPQPYSFESLESLEEIIWVIHKRSPLPHPGFARPVSPVGRLEYREYLCAA